jgi:peptidyl-prolyl cis-trans isomerase B (cyclophilin B)
MPLFPAFRFPALLAGLSLIAGAAFAQAQNPAPAAALPLVEIKTSMGSIYAELNQDKAPKSVANFLQYVKDGHYKGTLFHRVIDGFMVQGGGMDEKMVERKTRAPIDNEAANGLKNDVGTLAMARTNNVHSATAQFFINLKDNGFLNYRESTPEGYGYAVFGRVVKGMDVVERMAKVGTGNSGQHQDVPRTPVVIQSIDLLTPAAAKAALKEPAKAPGASAAAKK